MTNIHRVGAGVLSATALLSVAVVSTSAPAAAAAPATGYHLDAASTPGAIVGDPPPAQVGLAYRYQLSFTGRAPAIVEAGSSQGLPAGLTMDRTGLISGIPTMQPAGSSSVHLGAFDLDTRQLVERRLTFDLKDDMVPGAAATGSLDMPVGDREVTRDIFATKHGESLEITDSKLPAGFTIERVDAVRIRLTGTPTADQAGTYSLTVTARNTSLAIPVHTTQTFAVTITTGGGAPTPPSDPWTNDPEFKEVKVVKKDALGLSGGTFSTSCPADFPYLARFTDKYTNHFGYGTERNLSPGRINPGGVRVLEPGGIAVSTYGNGQGTLELNGMFNRHDKVGWQTGVQGNYFNWNVTTQNLTITMLCTSDKFGHGTRLYNDGGPT